MLNARQVFDIPDIYSFPGHGLPPVIHFDLKHLYREIKKSRSFTGTGFVFRKSDFVLLNIPYHPYQVRHENEQLLLS